MRKVLVRIGFAAVLVLSALAGAWLYFISYSPDRARYPVRGLDVSHHQGDIDWPRVAADDVEFAFIKATEGGDFVDSDFARNLAAARAAGIMAGAYHFFTLCRPARSRRPTFLRPCRSISQSCRQPSIWSMTETAQRGPRPPRCVPSWTLF